MQILHKKIRDLGQNPRLHRGLPGKNTPTNQRFHGSFSWYYWWKTSFPLALYMNPLWKLGYTFPSQLGMARFLSDPSTVVRLHKGKNNQIIQNPEKETVKQLTNLGKRQKRGPYLEGAFFFLFPFGLWKPLAEKNIFLRCSDAALAGDQGLACQCGSYLQAFNGAPQVFWAKRGRCHWTYFNQTLEDWVSEL